MPPPCVSTRNVPSWNVSSVGSSGTNTHAALRTKEQGVSNPVGRWMKVQGKVSKMQAHVISGVFMDVAVLKVSHSVGKDKDATALQGSQKAERVTFHRGDGTLHTGSIRRSAHQRGDG